MTTVRILAIATLGVLALAGCAVPGEQRSAEQVVREITNRVAHATPGVVITAETDPNHLLGRPGGYTSKATFVDSRIDPSGVLDPMPGSVDIGSSVEVFDDASGAERRAEYIRSIGEAAPVLTEYDYVAGSVLLRVSGELTPTQAAEYEAALTAAVG